MKNDDILNNQDEYKYGFNDKDVSVYKTEMGLDEEVVKAISNKKGEPEWMKEYRLKAYQHFISAPMPVLVLI